jgi:hypothetical protein
VPTPLDRKTQSGKPEKHSCVDFHEIRHPKILPKIFFVRLDRKFDDFRKIRTLTPKIPTQCRDSCRDSPFPINSCQQSRHMRPNTFVLIRLSEKVAPYVKRVGAAGGGGLLWPIQKHPLPVGGGVWGGLASSMPSSRFVYRLAKSGKVASAGGLFPPLALPVLARLRGIGRNV